VGVVFRKELLDTSRDRRTWFGMVIMPLLLVPLLLLAMPTVMERQTEKVRETTARVAVVGAEHHPELVAQLGQNPALTLVESSDPEADLAARKVHAIVYLPEGLRQAVANEVPAEIRIAFDASDQLSSSAQQRVHAALAAYSSELVAGRLAARGLDPTILHPFHWTVENLAPPQRMIGFALGLIMPMMLAMWATLGGLYAAIDAAAGEKERGTLEPLLSAPPSRLTLVLGKYLAVVLTSVIASAISLLGMVLAFLVRPDALLGPGHTGTARLGEVLPPTVVGVIFLVALGLAGVFSALQLAVSLYARSFKEAQTYLSPLSFVVVFPAIFTQFMTPDQVPAWFFFVPILNSLMVFKEVLMGLVNPEHILITLGVSLVGVRVALGFAVASFQREHVLFRV